MASYRRPAGGSFASCRAIDGVSEIRSDYTGTFYKSALQDRSARTLFPARYDELPEMLRRQGRDVSVGRTGSKSL